MLRTITGTRADAATFGWDPVLGLVTTEEADVEVTARVVGAVVVMVTGGLVSWCVVIATVFTRVTEVPGMVITVFSPANVAVVVSGGIPAYVVTTVEIGS